MDCPGTGDCTLRPIVGTSGLDLLRWAPHDYRMGIRKVAAGRGFPNGAVSLSARREHPAEIIPRGSQIVRPLPGSALLRSRPTQL